MFIFSIVRQFPERLGLVSRPPGSPPCCQGGKDEGVGGWRHRGLSGRGRYGWVPRPLGRARAASLARRLVRPAARVELASGRLLSRRCRAAPERRAGLGGLPCALPAAAVSVPSSGCGSGLCPLWGPTGRSCRLGCPRRRGAESGGAGRGGQAGVCPAPGPGQRGLFSLLGWRQFTRLAGPGRDETAARLPRSHGTGKFAAPPAPGGARQPRPAAAAAAKRYRGAGSPSLTRPGRGRGGR